MCDEIVDIVAIDGPVGAGKSSVGRRTAEVLGYAFLDTGAMYRAATWWALHKNVDLNDAQALVEATGAMPLDMREEEGRLHVMVGDHDITEIIRTPEVTRQIYRLDQVPGVRKHLVTLQRAFGARRPTVAEGRDMGTVVFPKARCKVYLDASLEERTRRRALELEAKGLPVDMEQLREEIRERDEKAMTRAASPLRRADDAHVVDTTGRSFDEVVAAIVELARAAS